MTVADSPEHIVMASFVNVTAGFSLLWSMSIDVLLAQPFASVIVTE